MRIFINLSSIVILLFIANKINAADNHNQYQTEAHKISLQLALNNTEHRVQVIASRIKPGMHGWTNLMEASITGDIVAVKKLLELGANVDKISDTNATALNLASHSGYVEIVSLLLKHGADPNFTGKDSITALINAAENGHIDIVKLLLEKGANARIKAASLIKKESALELAAVRGYTEIVKLLIPHLNAAADMNYALGLAAWKGYIQIVQMLLDAGANPNIKDKHNQFALFNAVNNKKYDTADLLINNGADVNLTGGRSNTFPLYIAVHHGNVDIAERLLKAGAHVSITSLSNQTLIEIAQSKQNSAMVSLLRSYKAPESTPELVRFYKSGIIVLSELTKTSNKRDYLKKILGKPINVIKLSDEMPYNDPTIVYERVKWVYDGIHFILSALQGVSLIDLTTQLINLSMNSV